MGFFYVGKGLGSRAYAHETEVGESAKIDKIQEIKESGHLPIVERVAFKGRTGLSEAEAFRLEAALIWALRPQLTNVVSGHSLGFIREKSDEIIQKAVSINFEGNIPAVFVWTAGARGGGSISHDFIAPDEAVVWENTRNWWVIGRGKLSALDRELAAGRTVDLISVTNGKIGGRGTVNIVNGVFQISGYCLNEVGRKASFIRKSREIEDVAVTKLRNELLGNQLLFDGEIAIAPNMRGAAPEGCIKLPKVSACLSD